MNMSGLRVIGNQHSMLQDEGRQPHTITRGGQLEVRLGYWVVACVFCILPA